jgi:hypothetical protein
LRLTVSWILALGITSVMRRVIRSALCSDGLISAIPLAELFTGYFLHPSYAVSRPDGTVVMRIQKQAAFFESRFSVERTAPLSPLDEQRVLLSLIMLVLLERQRG